MASDSVWEIHIDRRVIRECSLIRQYALICRKTFEDNGKAATVPQASGTGDTLLAKQIERCQHFVLIVLACCGIPMALSQKIRPGKVFSPKRHTY